VKNYYYLFVLSSFIKDRVGGSGGRVQGKDAGYKMLDIRYARSQGNKKDKSKRRGQILDH
jgi:hypothetical protein